MSQGYRAAFNREQIPILGYQGGIPDVGEEYLVKIYNERPALRNETPVVKRETPRPKLEIHALLQEKFDMTTESDWSALTAASLSTSVANEITQAATLGKYTLVNRWLSRRIWRGTTPLSFTLNLKFAAESNADIEVLRPCRELHRMCLPYEGDKALGSWVLSPPGPSPFQFWLTNDDGVGEVIDVYIGKFLIVKRAVIRRVSISFSPQFVKGGTPISAGASILFETFEIQTKESINSEVYNDREVNVDEEPPVVKVS